MWNENFYAAFSRLTRSVEDGRVISQFAAEANINLENEIETRDKG